jgi:2'-5' RNA ligase
MSEIRTPISVWLEPAEPARTGLAALIAELASRHAAPRFRPHITLYAGLARAADWPNVLARVAQTAGAVTVQAIGTGHSDALFKTLFLQIIPSAQLRALQRSVVAALNEPEDYAFAPHLSLIYKMLPEAARAAMAANVAAPTSFACDVLGAVGPSAAGWEDVEGWRMLSSVRL